MGNLRYFATCLDQNQEGYDANRIAYCSFEITKKQYESICEKDPIKNTFLSHQGYPVNTHESGHLGYYRNTHVCNEKESESFLYYNKALIKFPCYLPDAEDAIKWKQVGFPAKELLEYDRTIYGGI